jgi:hypothetical protein
MPVGKVFNAAQNQVLFSPVSNYYEGKAIRLALKNSALANQALEQEVEMADDKFDLESRKVADQERRTELYEDQEARLAAEQEAAFATEEGKKFLELFSVASAAYDQSPEASEEQRRAFAFETMIDEADRIMPGSRDAAIEEFAKNDITAETFDVRNIRARIGERPEQIKESEYKAKTTYVGEDGKEYHMWFDEQGGQHKTGILAKTDSGQDINFEPPNKSEIESATALLESDEVLDDLPRKEKVVAAMMLANDIRQLQANLGKSYEEAAAMAIEGVKKKVSLEDDFFTGSDSKLNIGLNENEYRGKDGNIYIETEDGGFRRKN